MKGCWGAANNLLDLTLITKCANILNRVYSYMSPSLNTLNIEWMHLNFWKNDPATHCSTDCMTLPSSTGLCSQ